MWLQGMPNASRVSWLINSIYQAFFPSPRNPAEINLSLLEDTKSCKLLYSEELTLLVNSLRRSRSKLNCVMIDYLDHLLKV